ncbi:MAG: hypothetical protein DMD37_08880 [Gemmatimonadetes bacterium]|nr:MAG: hypothetical protein DMD74_00950 [Gemmatimonadota bacterium]PYO68409.1 MAG: hypothetical protein DMD71_06045 [Gemmatimonadota bacterium]PYO85434.1 MAG: hypothetical protein DMD68_03795 [Gemmatimonadota bacterium]PYP62710.1 MAG: hypothetical protein DMD37_08880 [Gemmatimonadota bacterium]
MRLEELRALVAQRGTALSGEESAYLEKWYRQCPGKEQWDVRAYAAPTGVGAREYRVIRGSGGQDVYRSSDRERATVVRTALNEFESLEPPALSGVG